MALFCYIVIVTCIGGVPSSEYIVKIIGIVDIGVLAIPELRLGIHNIKLAY
jgi:hypothetical protein